MVTNLAKNASNILVAPNILGANILYIYIVNKYKIFMFPSLKSNLVVLHINLSGELNVEHA